MSNMSYVRFENTYHDLEDCWDAMLHNEELSESERYYRNKLIELAHEIAFHFDKKSRKDDDKV